MELLASEAFVDEGFPRRSFYLCQSQLLAGLAAEIQPTSRYFALFLAFDGRGIEDAVIRDFAHAMFKKGLACLCAWGPDDWGGRECR